MMNTGILISGRGSNMQSLIRACSEPSYPANVAVVISNRPKAPGLEFARQAGLPAIAIDHTAFADRESFEEELDAALRAHGVELVCNAGFMRLLTTRFVERWRDRQLNIHPSLLPAYKGLHTHERVLADGVKITGCTVHFVRTDMDSGPIIAQAAVPVLDGDTADTLAARVLAAEHRLYPHALRLVAGGKVQVAGKRVIIAGDPPAQAAVYSPGLPPD